MSSAPRARASSSAARADTKFSQNRTLAGRMAIGRRRGKCSADDSSATRADGCPRVPWKDKRVLRYSVAAVISRTSARPEGARPASMPAHGKPLSHRQNARKSLGRAAPFLSRSFRALSVFIRFPRALPWVGMGRTIGAHCAAHRLRHYFKTLYPCGCNSLASGNRRVVGATLCFGVR